MISILYALYSGVLFSVANRIRGGWIVNNYNRVLAVMVLMIGLFVVSQSIVISSIIPLFWLLGSLLGWGIAIGATCGWETKELSENKYIDSLTNFIVGKPKLNSNGVGYKNQFHLRLWGTVWLTFRGILWGIILMIPTICIMLFFPYIIPLSILKLMYIMYGFSCMGIAYESMSLITNNKKVWEVSEFVYGFIIGVVISILL